MSIQLLSKVWTLDVKGTEREVLQVMCDHADDMGREARPSIAYIAWKVGCDERTVIRHIKALRQKGALLLERKARDHSPNVYRVNLSVYAPKQKFEPKGDAGADAFNAERGDILAERGDKMTKRGDTTMSPEPSFESPLKENKTDVDDMPPPKAQAWRELADLLITYSPITLDKFCEIWDRFPDPRRHAFALDQTRKFANPVSFRYYETTFLRYNPDKQKPQYEKPREQFTRPPVRSTLPIRTD